MLSHAFRATGLLSTADTAKRLGVDRTTVWHWISSGSMRAKRVGRFYGVQASEVARFRALLRKARAA